MNRRRFLQVTGLTVGAMALPKVASAGAPYKCVAGWPGWTRCQSVGAHFGYRWNDLDVSHGKIPHVKVGWDTAWTGEAAIRAAARSGSIMICNEMSLGTSVDDQATVLHRLFDVILDENPACYVLGPNDIVWEPDTKWLGYENISAVANRYKQRYGHVPPFTGFGFHAYHYPRSQYRNAAKLPNMIYAAVDEVRRVYGDIHVQLTETGSLVGEQAALESMPLIEEGLQAGVWAWFWFVSHSVQGCSVWDGAWNLTQVGRAYRDM